MCKLNQNQLLIVSSSQDCYIRVWKLSANNNSASNIQCEKLNYVKNEQKINEDDEDEDYLETNFIRNDEIKLKSTLFTIKLNDDNDLIEYSLNLESVLYGHEDWVYSVKWHPYNKINKKQELMFVSSSIDKTMVVWKYDETNSVWLDIVSQEEIIMLLIRFYLNNLCFR